MKVVISSGHGLYVRGASGYIDEVDEARRVVDETARVLRAFGVGVQTFHDNTSHTVNENLSTIVEFHNDQDRDLDVSVHFNAYEPTTRPMGCEVLYTSSTGREYASTMVNTICNAVPFINRGPKERDDLAFLNNTDEPAILIETCFCDSQADSALYNAQFEAVCGAIAAALAEGGLPDRPPTEPPPTTEWAFYADGKCSYFGGPDDEGVSPSEDLAFIYSIDEAPHLFLPYQPDGTTGLARRLNPNVHYIACRWDYDVTSRDVLKRNLAWVESKKTGYGMVAFPADWGPHEDTGRVADLSPSLLNDLKLETDDEVIVKFPYDE